jgi:hypothetical protein
MSQPFLVDKGVGVNDIQSVMFQTYWDALKAAINGIDCVLSGGVCSAQGTPDMTIAVAKAGVLTNGVLKAVAAGNATIGAADATNPRLDLVVINSAGAIATRAGTAAANPKPPARTANDVVLAVVYVPANDTTMGETQIIDARFLRTQGPITIAKVTSPVTFNTTLAIQTLLSVLFPSGLFLSGKVARVRCGGTFLFNSGTPTLTFTIAYGGTTLFADVSIAGAVDADRGAWRIEFDLIAQANNDQALNGYITFSPVIAQRIAATTGVGDMLLSATAANANLQTPINGAAAVDSDAADRTLTVQQTMSVSNIADEVLMEYATVELV